MAIRPREGPRAQSSDATLDSATLGPYKRGRIYCDYVVTHITSGTETIRRQFNNVGPDPAEHEALRDLHGPRVVQMVEERESLKDNEDIAEGSKAWKDLPEGPNKRRIAQHDLRLAAELASEGYDKQGHGRTRHEAAQAFFQARKICNWIIPHLTGSPAEKRTYLNMTAEEWSSIRDWHDDADNNVAAYNGFITYMAAAPDVIEIESEVNI